MKGLPLQQRTPLCVPTALLQPVPALLLQPPAALLLQQQQPGSARGRMVAAKVRRPLALPQAKQQAIAAPADTLIFPTAVQLSDEEKEAAAVIRALLRNDNHRYLGGEELHRETVQRFVMKSDPEKQGLAERVADQITKAVGKKEMQRHRAAITEGVVAAAVRVPKESTTPQMHVVIGIQAQFG